MPQAVATQADVQKPGKIDEYRVQVLPPERARDLYAALPSHVKPAVFERNLVNALMANPSLMDFDPRLIFREVSKAAGLGLLLDPILGEGYIVTAYNYKTRSTEPQLRVGYKGMCKLARQTGDVANIYAHEIHQLDHVEADLGYPKVFHHKPKLFSDRGPIIGYVAIITFKDGSFDFEPMSVEQCHAIRDRSDAWKAYMDKKIKSTPWATDDSEMSKKTVMRRLMKRQEQSPELGEAIRIEDQAEFPEMGTYEPSKPRASVPSPSSAQLSAPEPETESTSNEPEIPAAPPTPAEPSELATVEGEGMKAWAARYVAAIQTSTTEGELNQWDARNNAALEMIYAKARDTVFSEIMKAFEAQKDKLLQAAPPTSSRPKPNAETAQAAPSGNLGYPDPATDYEAFLKHCETALNSATSADDLTAFYDATVAKHEDNLLPPDRDELVGIYDKAMRKFEP